MREATRTNQMEKPTKFENRKNASSYSLTYVFTPVAVNDPLPVDIVRKDAELDPQRDLVCDRQRLVHACATNENAPA